MEAQGGRLSVALSAQRTHREGISGWAPFSSRTFLSSHSPISPAVPALAQGGDLRDLLFERKPANTGEGRELEGAHVQERQARSMMAKHSGGRVGASFVSRQRPHLTPSFARAEGSRPSPSMHSAM